MKVPTQSAKVLRVCPVLFVYSLGSSWLNLSQSEVDLATRCWTRCDESNLSTVCEMIRNGGNSGRE